MEHCSKLKGYLLGTLGEKDRAEFESHLSECETCASEAESWRQFYGDFNDWVGSLNAPLISEECAERLNREARNRGPKRAVQWNIRPAQVVVAIAAATIVGLFFVLSRPDAPSHHHPLRVTSQAPMPEVLLSQGGEVVHGNGNSSTGLAVPGPGRLVVALDKDRVALGEHSRARVSRSMDGGTRIELTRGTAAVWAHKRSIGELTVEAMGHRVRVVGTRFQVSLLPQSGISVAVSEGEVEVRTADGEEKNVRQGEILVISSSHKISSAPLTPDGERKMERLLQVEDGRKESESETKNPDARLARGADQGEPSRNRAPSTPKSGRPTKPNLTEVRKLILGGQYSKAHAILTERLKYSPRDTAAWELLANCRRKSGNWEGAIKSFEKVIDLGNAGQANRARFMAATLMQDKLKDNRRARELLRDYLSHRPKPLEAEAMVRLARAQLGMGQTEAAGATAAKVIEKYPGTPAALLARELVPSVDSTPRE